MVVPPSTTEPVELTTTAEFDQERQTIEKSLSKLSPPIVRISCVMAINSFVSLDSRYRKSKCIGENPTATFNTIAIGLFH